MQKYLKWAVAAFIVFYLFSNPSGAAGRVNDTIDLAEHAGDSLATFVNGIG